MKTKPLLCKYNLGFEQKKLSCLTCTFVSQISMIVTLIFAKTYVKTSHSFLLSKCHNHFTHRWNIYSSRNGNLYLLSMHPDKGGKFEMFEFDMYVFQVSTIVILNPAKTVQLVLLK